MAIAKKRALGKAQSNAAEIARLAAAEYCLLHYPTLYTAGLPRRGLAGSWHVPIVISHPTRGIVGTVGELTVDARTGHVVDQPGRDKVLAAGKALARVKHNGQAAPAAATRKRR